MYKRGNEIVKCRDGFSMSVQASERNYSHPRLARWDDIGRASCAGKNKDCYGEK